MIARVMARLHWMKRPPGWPGGADTQVIGRGLSCISRKFRLRRILARAAARPGQLKPVVAACRIGYRMADRVGYRTRKAEHRLSHPEPDLVQDDRVLDANIVLFCAPSEVRLQLCLPDFRPGRIATAIVAMPEAY